MNAMEDAFGVEDVKTGFLANLSSLCASVVENVNDANRYSTHQDTTQLVKNCFYCVAMMLNFNDKEGLFYLPVFVAKYNVIIIMTLPMTCCTV